MLGQAVLVAQPVDRVGGVVDRLVARREDRDERVPVGVARRLGAHLAGWLAVVAVRRGEQREPGGEQVVEQRLDELDERQVDVGGIRGREPVDLEERRHAGRDLRPDRRGVAGMSPSSARRSPGAATQWSSSHSG